MARKEFQVRVRDSTLKTIGIIDDYTSLTVVPRFNGVGAFTMEISASSPKAALLVEGNGLVIYRNGNFIMSGPIRSPDWSKTSSDGAAGSLTISGVDDTTVLAEATCWPNPTAAIGSQTSAVYKITATKSETAMRSLVNLNIGPGAQTSRKNTILTLATDGLHGSTITKQINQFDNLLTTLQDIAAADGLGFRVVQSGTNLEFQVYVPHDLSATAKFSFGLGNLTDASYSVTPPTCTKAIVVVGGASTARVCKVFTRTDPLFPTLVIEQFIDKTDVDSTATDVNDQTTQAANEALTNGAAKGNLSITPIDTPSLQYSRDYNVGDKISAQVRAGDYFSDVVREVTITSSSDYGTVVKATIGPQDSTDTKFADRVYAYIRQLKKDVLRLKTRKQS